jgi:hypothetical protein
LQVDLPADAAEQACRRAISALGWRLLEDDGRRLVVKEITRWRGTEVERSASMPQ